MREEILIKNLQNGDASALDELISMITRRSCGTASGCAGSHTGGRCGTGNFFEGCEISWKFRIFR